MKNDSNTEHISVCVAAGVAHRRGSGRGSDENRKAHRAGRRRALCTAFLAFAAFGLVGAASAHADAVATAGMLEAIDDARTLENADFSAVMTLVAEDPEEGIDRRKVRMFRRDRDGAYVLLILEPQVNRGQGYLQIDDALWFYDPESRSFSHTSQSESFQGSDARNSDFESSTLAEDYEITSAAVGRLGAYEVYVLDLEATNNEVTYPSVKLWVTQEEHLVLKSEDYSVTGRLLRTSYFPRYASVADAYVPTQVIFIDELVENKKTTITLSDISTAELPDSVFTKAYVERASR